MMGKLKNRDMKELAMHVCKHQREVDKVVHFKWTRSVWRRRLLFRNTWNKSFQGLLLQCQKPLQYIKRPNSPERQANRHMGRSWWLPSSTAPCILCNCLRYSVKVKKESRCLTLGTRIQSTNTPSTLHSKKIEPPLYMSVQLQNRKRMFTLPIYDFNSFHIGCAFKHTKETAHQSWNTHIHTHTKTKERKHYLNWTTGALYLTGLLVRDTRSESRQANSRSSITPDFSSPRNSWGDIWWLFFKLP